PIAYVRGGDVGGDGSPMSPFGSIGEALNAVPDGGVIALGPGTYTTSHTLPDGVTLWGACPARTVIAPTACTSAASLLAVTGAAAVRSLRIGGGQCVGIRVSGSADVTLEDVVIEGARLSGMLVDNGGQLSARRVLVDTTLPIVDGSRGRGASVESGARLTLEQVEFRNNSEVGLFAFTESTRITGTDVAVRGTHLQGSTGLLGVGVMASAGGELTLERSVV